MRALTSDAPALAPDWEAEENSPLKPPKLRLRTAGNSAITHYHPNIQDHDINVSKIFYGEK
ncbi:hypothetical protein QUA99_25305 [Microcoleus sp. F10-B2]